ncbi:hypothetical protein E2562_004027 [Oryza meyeriana var. granulata]|uniref:Uncharacterized protein n=1 Tax=Oryza meyeriana var. granulata TaxID=110450 RepID=A0A6G1BHJ5_9ORYZ|nr:hypothetical protein E2562_004027 [Oryza meyeriana var. granulata]
MASGQCGADLFLLNLHTLRWMWQCIRNVEHATTRAAATSTSATPSSVSVTATRTSVGQCSLRLLLDLPHAPVAVVGAVAP